MSSDDTTPPEAGRGTSLRALWLNALALALVLLAILPLVTDGTAIVVPDEGLYLAQADALADGSWYKPIPASDVDPEGTLHVMSPDTVIGDRVVNYARHAAYPLLLTPLYSLWGYTGTLLLSILGTWAAAVTGAFIARRLRHGYALWALWILGVGSPLLFDSYITMGHSILAAMAGIAFLGLTTWIEDRRWWALAYMVPSTVMLVLLRSEGVLLALGMAAATTLASVQLRRRRIDWPAALTGVGLGALAVATYLVDMRISDAITGVEGYGVNPVEIATRKSAGPWSGIWASLLRPFEGGWESAGISVPLAALGMILGLAVLRFLPSRKLLALGFFAGSAAAGVGMLLNEPGLVTGLLAACPLLAGGLVCLGKDDLRVPLVRRALIACGIAAVMIAATNYEVGGAAEWGGRFFHQLLPLLIPLAVLGIDRARTALSEPEWRFALACMALVTLSLSVSALRFQANARHFVNDLTSGTVAYAQEQFDRERPLVVVAMLRPDGTGRYFWADADQADIITSYDLRHVYSVLRQARDAGRERAVIATNVDGLLFGTTLDKALDELGWELLDIDTTPQGSMTVVTVGSGESNR